MQNQNNNGVQNAPKTKIQRKHRDFYREKVQGCIALTACDEQHISNKTINQIAKNVKIPTHILKSAWATFQQTGGKQVDRRVSTKKGSLKFTPSVVCKNHMRTNVSAQEAASIILTYMNSNELNSRELCNAHNISVSQFYGWIKELNVKGTLMGNTILNPKKYAKCETKDVIWYYKYPNTSRKSIVSLSAMEQHQYERIAYVLVKYLADLKNSKKTKKSN